MERKKLIAFAGSNSAKSINKIFLQFVLEKFKEYEIEVLDINDYQMPIYSEDIEREIGVPQEAITFRNKMHSADAIVVSLAEHNAYITVAMKNILDWGSKIDKSMEIFGGKPMLLMSVSTGRGAAKMALEGMKLLVEKRYQAEVVETFSLPSYNHVFVENTIIDDLLKEELEEKVDHFKKVLKSEKILVEE